MSKPKAPKIPPPPPPVPPPEKPPEVEVAPDKKKKTRKNSSGKSRLTVALGNIGGGSGLGGIQ